MKILDSKQIEQKIKRLAFQILEINHEEDKIFLLGINTKGLQFAKKLANQIGKISDTEVVLHNIKINAANPTATDIEIDTDISQLKNKCLIIVDDVANTGRTLFYACKPLMEIVPKKLEVAVLIDRKHKSFPIAVDYMGLSLATTVQENIDVNLKSIKSQEVILN
jgi:pyrimidine operon attenuation protein/uracil phosphoribosyltransferase